MCTVKIEDYSELAEYQHYEMFATIIAEDHAFWFLMIWLSCHEV